MLLPKGGPRSLVDFARQNFRRHLRDEGPKGPFKSPRFGKCRQEPARHIFVPAPEISPEVILR